MMEVIRQLVAEGWQVTAEDLAQLSPYLTSHILRFGAYATDELHIPPDVFDPALVRDLRRLDAAASAAGPSRRAMPAGLIANTVAAMLWAWSTCPECRDRRWTG